LIEDVKNKSWSCYDLHNSLFLAPDEVRTCCKRFFVDGEMKGDVTIAKANKEDPSSITLQTLLDGKKDLYNDIVRLRVRFTTELSHKKISEYRNEMNANNSTKGFTLTIVRRDGKKVLVGGNHTLESAHLSKCKYIEVVWIEEDLTMEEMHSLGTALNRKTEVARMTTDFEDCANDLVTLFYAKKITDDTFKDAYSTKYIKVTGGFKGNEIPKVRKIAKETIAEKKSWKKGKKWKTWKLKPAQLEIEAIRSALTSDTVLCLSASGGEFRVDRLCNDWVRDSDARIKLGLKPRTTLQIQMHYPTYKNMQEYYKEQKSKRHKRSIMHHVIGYIIEENLYKIAAKEIVMERPSVELVDLGFWEDKIS